MQGANRMIDEVVKLISKFVSANSHQKYNGWLNDNDVSSYRRWFYCMVELNNELINNHLTLEAFPVIHILKSFPQRKCEIYSLIHSGKRSTSVYQFCQLIKITFLNWGLF